MSSNYVPGQNAHIDTRAFVEELERLADGATGRDLDDMEFEETAYYAVQRILSNEPKAVSPETVVCRYLDTEKFLWFLNTQSIYFGRLTDLMMLGTVQYLGITLARSASSTLRKVALQ